MKCKLHPSEPGGAGVCASCLRERLLHVLAAQVKEAESAGDNRKSDPLPPSLPFPRSVSPYICGRSVHDTSDRHNHCPIFYSTPLGGPTSEKKKKKSRGLSLLSSLLSASGSGKKDKDPSRSSKAPIASSLSSWFSAFRKKKSRLFSLEDEIATIGARRTCQMTDRGLSPTTKEEEEEEEEEGKGDESPAATGYYSEAASVGRKSTPVAAASVHRRRAASRHARNVTNFAFCLSPLMGARLHCHRHDTGFSGELRGKNRHRWSNAPSLFANRSRKMADFGRYP